MHRSRELETPVHGVLSVCSFYNNLFFLSRLPCMMQVLATLLNWHLLWNQVMMLQSLGSL